MSESKTRRAFPLVLVPDIPKILPEKEQKGSVILAKKKKLIIFNESRKNKARRRTERSTYGKERMDT